MKKEIIVFDKDGTLIDFDAYWVTVSVIAIKEVLHMLGKEEASLEKLLQSIGIENGVTDIDGVVCCGTYEETGLAFYEALKEYGETKPADEVAELLTDAYKRNFDAGIIKATCDNLKEVLERLKKEGRTLLVASADRIEYTNHCLTKLGIREYFDAVFADDGIMPPKPDATCFNEYLKTVGKTAEQAVIVGDTMTDVRFSKNAGIQMIGVGKTEKNRNRLKPYADMVIRDVSTVCEAIYELEQRTNSSEVER